METGAHGPKAARDHHSRRRIKRVRRVYKLWQPKSSALGPGVGVGVVFDAIQAKMAKIDLRRWVLVL